MKGKGNTDETLRQSVLLAQGEVVIKAVDGLHIDIKQINQKTVSQTIEAMVKADPQLAWLKEAEARGDVDWRRVKEVHDSFKYQNSSLGGGAAIIIAIVLSVITAGAGAAIAAAAGGAVGGGTVGTVVGAMAQGAFHASVAQTAVSTINNKGNPLAVIKDTHSAESIKGYAYSGLTAGVTAGLGYNPTNFTVKDVAIKVAADTVVKSAVYGGSFKDNLAEAALGNAISIVGALGANEIGNLKLADGGLSKIALHAALGGLMAEAMGGDFRTGALAAGANEALVDFLADKLLPQGKDENSLEYQQGKQNLLAASQIIGVLAAGLTGGDAEAGAAVAANATANNYLLHREETVAAVDQVMARCQRSSACAEQFSKLDSQEVMNAFEVMAAKDEQALAAIDPDARLFAAQMLHGDVSLAERIFIPETGAEKALDTVKTTVEWVDTLAGFGGAAVALKGGIKALAGVFARGVTKGIDDVISSASRSARVGSQDSRALQALKKKIDRGDDAFSGLPKTQDAANDLIRQTLGAKNPIVRTKIRNGQTVRDVFDQSTGRGVRTIDGKFDTFVNLE